ncbi:L,D-transpeptidase [Prosthecochloris sp. GSB1]|uniref:L,D-transpeptidase n=1 Tax=Prosthecochloris sp. GSB1 TaxID=281093 RepID=UPI000B8CC3D7|nr:L,D-transpeptidase [Prosthecochloris sp. GSB1]ASQ90396.1 L,D-transpeptidase [Prosthecochloris sp. GSB1]
MEITRILPLVLFFASLAHERTVLSGASKPPAEAPSPSLAVVAKPSEREAVAASEPIRINDSEATPGVPAGFTLLKLEKSQSRAVLCNRDSLCESIFIRVNRIDRKRISAGKTVLVPVDIGKASEYVPVPRELADSRGEREIRVFLDDQYFGAYENGKLLFWGPVSSGRKSYPTARGMFFVNYKQRHKRSIKYDNAPMPYSINYHYGFFMHQQSLPGYPASHGCIRLLMPDAERLFQWARIGDPVTVL